MADSPPPFGFGLTSAAVRKPRDVASAVERYFQISLFLLVATGFLTLIATRRLDSLSVLFVILALLLRGYLLLQGRELKIPEKWTNYFTLIYVLVFVVDLFLISGSYVTASVHLVLFSLVVKLFSIQRERDYLYLAVLSFLAVLAASVLTVDTTFLAAFCVFILLAVNTFISMEIRRSMRKAAHFGQISQQSRISRLTVSLSTTGMLIVFAILISSAGFFFLLPRFSAGYLSSFSAQNDLVSGFSDQVKLGEIGRIKQSDTVVMHVLMDSANPMDVKWRGMALTVFDGKSWKNEAGDQEVLDSYTGRYSLRRMQVRKLNLPPVQDPRDFRLLRYRIMMEPIGTNVLFLASVPVEVGGRFREISIDGAGSISNIDHTRMTDNYEAVSQVPQPSMDKLRSASTDLPPGVALTYLQLPVVDQRVRDLAVKITAKIASNYDKAAAIEHYLRSNYGYTLNLGNVQPADPIEYFLFERKQGHCEYFASTMAVMLRTIGIPTRIVNGFRSGEFNDLTGNYIIRARDAHSWVEVYLPDVGWTEFDPTPPDPLPTVNSWSRIRLYLDAAQEFWREWIINYDFGHQRELTVSTISQAQRSAWNTRRWLRYQYHSLLKKVERINSRVSQHPWRWVPIGFLLLVIAFGLLNVRAIAKALRQRAIAQHPSKAPQVAATIWYSRMVKTVARKGYPKTATQTPKEFVKAIPEAPLRESVSKFTDRYERARFGQSAADAEQLPELFEEITNKK